MAAKSVMAEELAPLCDSSATGPGTLGSPGTEQTGTPSVRLAKPRWFGPSSTMPSPAAWRGRLARAARGARPALARLGVAGRQHARVADPGGRRVVQGLQQAGLGHHHVGHVDRLADLARPGHAA